MNHAKFVIIHANLVWQEDLNLAKRVENLIRELYPIQLLSACVRKDFMMLEFLCAHPVIIAVLVAMVLLIRIA
jgi:hypothetical protein